MRIVSWNVARRRSGAGRPRARAGPDNDLIAPAPRLLRCRCAEFPGSWKDGCWWLPTFQVEGSVDSSDPNLHVVVAEGELDLVTVGEFQEQLDALVDGTGRRLLLDLRGLRFIDSRGITALYQARASFAHMAVVVAPDSNVARILAISGFVQVLPLFDSLFEARRKLA